MKENGFEYVDLGLPSGTMWATCNVGADKPEDDGLLFQFGRVDGYKYGDETNKFRTNKQNLEDGSSSEYIPVLPTGNKYEKGEVLKLEDDAAYVNMGGKWKMPTNEQYQEMFNNTIHVVIKDHGTLFTSKINNKQLFVPFAGYWFDGNFRAIGTSGSIWSSRVNRSFGGVSYSLYCENGYSFIDSSYCGCALSVRGVFKK